MQGDRLSGMKAAIFDMDGTLLDSMGAWRALNVSFLHSIGADPTPEQEMAVYSMTGRAVVDYMRENFGIETDFETLAGRACRMMEDVYAQGVPHKPGAQRYLQRLRARGVKCVLATASPSKLALIAMNKADMVKDMDYIYSTDFVGGHKGDPAFFDRLCAMIGEKKEDCVMFEDALYSMKGARAAGLGVVAITDETNEHDREEILAVCDRLIDSYDELD